MKHTNWESLRKAELLLEEISYVSIDDECILQFSSKKNIVGPSLESADV